jgi:hypothetical protein
LGLRRRHIIDKPEENALRRPKSCCPKGYKPMMMYIVATNHIINIITVVERKEEGSEYPARD